MNADFIVVGTKELLDVAVVLEVPYPDEPVVD